MIVKSITHRHRCNISTGVNQMLESQTSLKFASCLKEKNTVPGQFGQCLCYSILFSIKERKKERKNNTSFETMWYGGRGGRGVTQPFMCHGQDPEWVYPCTNFIFFI